MMNSELNNHQTDWLAQTEEINDTEASQVNGGMVQAVSPVTPPPSSSGGAAPAPASSGGTEAAAMQSMQADQSARMEATMQSMRDAMSR
jgi:hypothetical protein